MVIPNIWAMQHNVEQFPDPLTFNPDRFLNDAHTRGPDTLIEGHYGFGFGRRICPGRHLGARTVWLGVTRLVWAFDIRPQTELDAASILPDPNNCTSGITSKPLPFDYTILPRSASHAATIARMYSAGCDRL